MEKESSNYYIGLDIGTNSVGWAVSDKNYEIIKKHGKALWGIRLFEMANPAEARRNFRISRRRTERRKQRLALLQEIFAEEIWKTDPGFYQRMKESRYRHEDKRDIEGNVPLLPYALFVDDGFTDKEFHAKYPTIFHLRYALATNKEEKPDIRLIYLALHHIIKHRGHFLFEGKKISEIKKFSTTIQTLVESAEEQGIEIELASDKVNELEKILKDKSKSKSAKKALAGKIFAGNDKQKKAIAALFTGCSVKMSDIFADETLDGEEITKICFSDGAYEEHEAEVESILADRFLLVAAAKAVYDWGILHDILGDSQSLSEAKVKLYDKHHNDLCRVKKLLKNDRAIYNDVFGVPSNDNLKNYSAYIGMVKKNGKKVAIDKKCSRDDFYKFLKKKLGELKIEDGQKEIIDELNEEMERGLLFPKH